MNKEVKKQLAEAYARLNKKSMNESVDINSLIKGFKKEGAEARKQGSSSLRVSDDNGNFIVIDQSGDDWDVDGTMLDSVDDIVDATLEILDGMDESKKNEAKLFGVEAYDMSDSNDNELSLIVFNTQELYNMRHDDTAGMLKMLKKAGFNWTKKQEKILMDDLKDDKEEMENEGYVAKTAEDFTSADGDEADAVEVPAGEEESEETVDAPEGDGEMGDDQAAANGDRLSNIEDMMKMLFKAVMDGDETINPDASVGEDLDDIETLNIGDATDDDLVDGEEDTDIIDLDLEDATDDDTDDVDADVDADVDNTDTGVAGDDDIEVIDLDGESEETDEPEEDLEEGIITALTFGDLTNPEWKKCVATLLGDNLQNTFPDH